MSEQRNNEAINAALRQRLQALPDALIPEHDQWPQIASRLSGTPAASKPEHGGGWQRWSQPWLQSLAAVLVLTVLVAVVWQQLPLPKSWLPDALVSVGPSVQSSARGDRRSDTQQATRSMLQGMRAETAASLPALPATLAGTELQAGLQEYELAEQQLQQALITQPDDQNLWQQLSSLQLSRLNMFTVHVQ